MLSPETLIDWHRRIQSRRLKAWAVAAMRAAGMRHLVIRMDTTNLCNLRCRMCYYSVEQKRKPQQMDMALFDKIANEVFPQTRFLYLSCATEPLMNRNFADFLDSVGRHHVPFTSFCTNGMLLSERVVESAIRANLSEIIFSVDGATPETYEYIRRGARWQTLVEKLDLFRALKEKAGAERPVGRINFTCMNRNIRELPALVRFTAAHGIRNIHVRHLLAFTDDGSEMTCRDQMEYRECFNRVVQEAQAEARRLAVELFLPDPIHAPTPSAAPAPPSRKREANPYCLIPWFQAIIGPGGDYRLCSRFKPFGNLREQSFAAIYRSAAMRQLRRSLLRRQPDACSWICDEEAYAASDDKPETPEATTTV
jgi:MoaA/NifB/PqqE/SkfB family radical SAM enzyme